MTPQDLITWIQAHVTRFSQSAFQVTATDGSILYFDLFQPLTDPQNAAVVLITHPHQDHFNADVVKSVRGPSTRVVVPTSMHVAQEDKGLATDHLGPGETLMVGAFSVTAVAAYTIGRDFHPQAKAWVGYVVEVDGLKIYHAGDTDLVLEMSGLKPDIALLPVGGMFTMHWDEAVRAAEVLGNPVVVPMHYGLVPLTGRKGQNFAKAYAGVTVLL